MLADTPALGRPRYDRTVQDEIRFALGSGNSRIAWASHGDGPPLVRVATWMTHLERDWESPIWRHWLDELGARFRVFRYDERGSGMSDHEVDDISLDAWVADLESVVDEARLDRFSLLGMSGAGLAAVAYAARHPERVTRLILYGVFLRGWDLRSHTDAESRQWDAEIALMRVAWGQANPVYRRIFTQQFVPGADEEQMLWFDDIQRQSMTGDTAVRRLLASARADVTRDAAALRVPTLVLHAHDDGVVPFEEGRRAAAAIPGACFVPLAGRNHIILAADAAWPRFLAEVTRFVGDGAPADALPGADQLTRREVDALRLVADGLSNDQIAARLDLSTRTVERHLSNIYLKLGLHGKSARAAAVARLAQRAAGR